MWALVFFHVFRGHPSSKFIPFPGILAKMLNPVIQERISKSINSSICKFYFRPPWSSILRIQAHTYSPDSFQQKSAGSCSSFGALSLSCLIRLRTSSAILQVSRYYCQFTACVQPSYRPLAVGKVIWILGQKHDTTWVRGLYKAFQCETGGGGEVLTLNRDEWTMSAGSKVQRYMGSQNLERHPCRCPHPIRILDFPNKSTWQDRLTLVGHLVISEFSPLNINS